jgi:hypothetical protein
MPLLNGLQATCQILKTAAATKVLMLSAHSGDAYVKAATNSGAMGYLIKQTSAGRLRPPSVIGNNSSAHKCWASARFSSSFRSMICWFRFVHRRQVLPVNAARSETEQRIVPEVTGGLR